MSKREPQLYLQDILDSISYIEEDIHDHTLASFINDRKTIQAVVRNIEIIGQAARNIAKELRVGYPAIPWEKMVSMRNKVLHEYFGIDLEILWKTIKEDLPPLKFQISELLKSSSS